MFNSAFDRLGAAEGDYYPPDLRAEIDALNARIYATVNNGVYRAGFATTQAAYEEAFRALFETLDWLEARLANQRFLCGERLTEADWRLFTTLIRFDPVYFGHFKCNLRRDRRLSRLAAAICASSTTGPESPRRSISSTSNIIITRAICASIRPGSCRWDRSWRCERRRRGQESLMAARPDAPVNRTSTIGLVALATAGAALAVALFAAISSRPAPAPGPAASPAQASLAMATCTGAVAESPDTRSGR